MASVTPSFAGVTPQWLQTTQPMITSSFLDTTGLGWTGTITTGGSKTVITDVDRFQMPYSSDRLWRGSYIRMISGTASNLGEVRQIQSYDPNSGFVSVSPGFTANTTAGDTYEMWNTPIFPKTVCSMLDRLISQSGLGLPTYSMLSEVPDFDMEQGGTAAWTSTNATIAKVPWAAAERGIAGKQALGVTTTSAGGYAQNAYPIGVKGGNTFWMSALFTPDDPSVTNTGFMEIVDAVTGQLVDSFETHSKASVRLWKPIANSSQNVRSVNIRFGSLESGVTGHWDDIVLLDAMTRDVPLPYWCGTESNFKEVFQWVPAVSGPGEEDYDPGLTGRPAMGWRPLTDAFSNGGQLRLRGQSPAPNMLYIYGVRQETAWGTDILATKRIDVPWATAALALSYWQRMKGQTILDKAQADLIAGYINWWHGEFMENDNRVRSFGRTQESPIMSWSES